ncbi:MAG: hypothetical protein JOZ02_21495 [Acidobacteria bacterium]|nr:hypothetical protein [Acidobacteriota bacterium]
MPYIFRGKLCGYICPDCREPLSKVKVRLYRAGDEREVVARAVANPKETFAILSEEQVDERRSRLIAEAETDDDGGFAFELNGDGQYDGGPVEVDVYCATVPRAKPQRKESEPVQFTITTLQPQWRESDRALVAYWDYCLPARYWCLVRGRFRVWTICGKVVLCEQKPPAPVAGVRVLAFDADITQDDALGSAVTGPDGHFRIDYTAADFKRTPISWISWEWVSGPDLYFRVESLGGATLLAEDRSRARQPDRENVGHCFCVELCVRDAPQVTHAWFTHVGDFYIDGDISNATGLTNGPQPAGMPNQHGGPGYGFYDGRHGWGIKLKGDCPSTHPFGGGQPMRYRFLYEDLDNDPGNKHPVNDTMVSAVEVGVRVVTWDTFGTGAVATPQAIWVGPTGATTPPPPPTPPAVPPGTPWGPVPPALMKPDADGWVQVDPASNLHGYSGPLLYFRTASAVPGGAAPGDGAGNAVSSPQNGTSLRVYFEAEPVAGPSLGAPTLGNDLKKIRINNWSEVILLNIQQFITPGANCCSPINANLDILYTADHELMKSWGVDITSCASGLGWVKPALPGGTGPRGGHGTSSHNTSTWPNCSYLVSLSTLRSLTDGEDDTDGGYVQLTFCIEH